MIIAIVFAVVFALLVIAIFRGADDPSEDRCDCSICNSGGGPHLPTQRKS